MHGEKRAQGTKGISESDRLQNKSHTKVNQFHSFHVLVPLSASEEERFFRLKKHVERIYGSEGGGGERGEEILLRI